jgi:catechol 2,3-dioxygenase-like lactoylglutathione lyase family enzyme
MTDKRTIGIERVDHIGIRVADTERAMTFYGMLGFEVFFDVPDDEVVIIKNANDLEINLITNADNPNDGKNILMDVTDKFAGVTHIALRVDSIRETIEVLAERGVQITQGPVKFGDDGHVSVFVRDPDRNVIELRGRDEDLSAIGGVVHYTPE